MVTETSREDFRGALPWLAGLATLALVLFHPGVLNDGDTFWHLATGDWILAHGAVPRTDPFSYTHGNGPWVCHEWLADLLMALAFKAAGWSGTVLLAGVAAAAAVFLFARYMDLWFPPLAVALLALVSITLAAPSLLVRPHILALPVLVAWMIALLDARTRTRAPCWHLLPLMTLWANLHGSYVLGLAVTGAFAVEAILAAPHEWRGTVRGWGLFLLAAVAASLVTPHGLSGLLYPFSLMNMESIPFIVEWRPPDFSTLQSLELALLAGLYFALSRGVRLPLIRLLLLLLVIHMALAHARHGILVCFVALLVIAEPLAAAGGRNPSLKRATQWRWAAIGVLLTVNSRAIVTP